MPRAFNLDQLQPIKPILFWNISIFFTFILGKHFLLPQRTNNGKGEFIQLQYWIRQGVFIAWGIQTGPFAAHSAHFVLEIFQLFHFHTGEPILITPEGQQWKRGIQPTSKLDETEGFGCLGHSKWTICSPLSPFCSEIFPSFSPSYWGAISYYPRGLIMEKRVFSQLQNWMRQKGLGTWGIQTGPFAAHSAHFVLKNFHFFHLHTGRPIHITPEG